MLYFMTNDGHDIHWHTGSPVPAVWQRPGEVRKVVGVYADGHERDYMQRLGVEAPLHYLEVKGREAALIYLLMQAKEQK